MFGGNPDRVHWILPGAISRKINVGTPKGNLDRRSENIIGSITEGIRGEPPVKNPGGSKFLKKTIEDIQEQYLDEINYWRNLNRNCFT